MRWSSIPPRERLPGICWSAVGVHQVAYARALEKVDRR